MAFIVFEGLDGAGKSTLISTLEEKLEQTDTKYLLTREPGGTPLAEELRAILLRTDGESPLPKTELLLYAAGRAQHVEAKIRPALDKGAWVLSDRFTASTYAFQKGGRKIDEEAIHWINDFACSGLRPDLNVLLDLPVEVSLERMNSRATSTGIEKDRFEQEEKDFHQKVRSAYLELAAKSPKTWLILDATKSREDLKKEFLSAMSRFGL